MNVLIKAEILWGSRDTMYWLTLTAPHGTVRIQQWISFLLSDDWIPKGKKQIEKSRQCRENWDTCIATVFQPYHYWHWLKQSAHAGSKQTIETSLLWFWGLL